ncbi:M20/M25/M40 family metallo-hydrolase [Legionella sp. CNM-4043-24]|uniref:M20/M25/M40 family metallo-hydrolase n=1 Tax=Legionella sp. CNM-4043-24 TaxID=3421646 RepID=UPI00403AF4FE
MLFTLFTAIALAFAQMDCLTDHSLPAVVSLLSSDAMGGRLAGSPGEQRATEYVANTFRCLGLEPAGDHGSYFQEFDVRAGVSLGLNNRLTLRTADGHAQDLDLNQDWRPLSFSDNQRFESQELIVAGYGITAPALGRFPAYDSYKGLEVKGKWVLVFRYAPENVSDGQRRQLSRYSSPRHKAFTARDHGARGILFVSGPNSRVRQELIPLSLDASLSGSGLVALSLTDKTADDLLKNTGYSLKTLQDRLDLGEMVSLPALTGIRLNGQTDIRQNSRRARNVLARLRVGKSDAPMLVVSAHGDHLGHGELSGSRERGTNRPIHPGADDNASGVAAVLDAAAQLSRMEAKGQLSGKRDILFAVWSGEESGLLGSAWFVKQFMRQSPDKSLRSAIEANLNLDMVGRLRQHLVLQGVGSSPAWTALLEQANVRHHLPLITQSDPYLPTDSTSFYLHGVPALNFFTGSHDEYHSARDTADTLNYEGLQRISLFLVDVIRAMEETAPAITYRSVPKTGDKAGRGFRVYLGTIPDYASSDRSGVALSAVTRDSPAEQAGVQAHDVIIGLAGKNVRDIYDYSFVLNTLRVGESVTMQVQRGQERLNLTIVPRARE